MTNNVVTAVFGAIHFTSTRQIWQYDYGMILKFQGLNLPTTYEVEFSVTEKSGETITVLGDSSGVLIPDELLLKGSDIYAWLFLHTGADDGEVVYKVTIPVMQKPERSNIEPTPVEQSIIEQAIALLNTAVDDAEGYAETASQKADEALQSATSAEQSATDAAASASAAAASATNAASSATLADNFATSASLSATHAAESASDALASADRAEQAAANAGYMFFYIDSNGDLIYQRTSTTQVDFYLDDGDLFVRANA